MQERNSALNSGHSVGFDNSGNVYVYGRFFGTVDFDPDPDETYNLTQNEEGYGHDAYLVKLNSSGSLEWARNFGDSNYPEGGAGPLFPGRGAMAVDGSGNTYTVGTFTGPDTFDPASDPIGSQGESEIGSCSHASRSSAERYLFSMATSNMYSSNHESFIT
mgnify:CR=1 FL=1